MSEPNQSIILQNESATESLGRKIAEGIIQHFENHSQKPWVIFLEGELAAGKTTLVRGFLRAFQHVGAVKSPTYTLVEEYSFPPDKHIYHFDLYRLVEAQELEMMGIRDYFIDGGILLIEWAGRGKSYLPPADLLLHLKVIPQGRLLEIRYLTERGSLLKSYIQ